MWCNLQSPQYSYTSVWCNLHGNTTTPVITVQLHLCVVQPATENNHTCHHSTVTPLCGATCHHSTVTPLCGATCSHHSTVTPLCGATCSHHSTVTPLCGATCSHHSTVTPLCGATCNGKQPHLSSQYSYTSVWCNLQSSQYSYTSVWCNLQSSQYSYTSVWCNLQSSQYSYTSVWCNLQWKTSTPVISTVTPLLGATCKVTQPHLSSQYIQLHHCFGTV